MKKSQLILKEIEKFLEKNDDVRSKDIVMKFPNHAPLVGYVFKKAVQEGLLIKLGSTRGARYVLAQARADSHGIVKTYMRGQQSEDDIFVELQDLFLRRQDVDENARHIVAYAFTEMVNNAIDHSRSETVEVAMRIDDGSLRFTVRDHGIGAFASVMHGLKLSSERVAAAELTKGKVTTAPKWHSGQGIFFTSRAADVFRLTSGSLTLERRGGPGGEVRILENASVVEGTLVEFVIATNTDRHLAEDVFGQFESDTDEHDFGKTEIRVDLFRRGDVHVSRSQAKRIMSGLEKFKIVILDFAYIPIIGQGFADQIFRIFVREHPGTQLVVKNALPAVQMMIDRVEKPTSS